MSNPSEFKNLLHNVKNPVQGMLDALEHLDQMYNDGEDLTNVTKVLNNVTQQVNKEWIKLNIFLEDKGK